MLSRAINALIIAIGISTLTCAAQAAPQQALNKTVQLTFNVYVPGKSPDGRTVNVTRNFTQQIFISSQGRLFAKMATRAVNLTGGKLDGPGEGSFRFVGDKIVGLNQHVSGASQQIITFDPSFQTCSASILAGTESGKLFSWKGLDGVIYTATAKPEISGVSCSISQGNAVAN
jgi:hypothetical protein